MFAKCKNKNLLFDEDCTKLVLDGLEFAHVYINRTVKFFFLPHSLVCWKLGAECRVNCDMVPLE